MRGEFDDLIGMPFQRYGRGPDSWDCWGIVVESGRRMGKETPDYLHIPMDNAKRVWWEIEQAMPEYRKVNDPQRGDIALFKSLQGEAHFGRMISSSHGISANEDLGVHIFDTTGAVGHLVKGYYRCLSE